jgi:hypothetical protein
MSSYFALTPLHLYLVQGFVEPSKALLTQLLRVKPTRKSKHDDYIKYTRWFLCSYTSEWGCSVAVTSNSDKQTEFLISLSPISAVWFLMTTFFEKQCFVIKKIKIKCVSPFSI